MLVIWLILGERRTLWGEREQSMHYSIGCYVAKASSVKYQVTTHSPVMHLLRNRESRRSCNSLVPRPHPVRVSLGAVLLSLMSPILCKSCRWAKSQSVKIIDARMPLASVPYAHTHMLTTHQSNFEPAPDFQKFIASQMIFMVPQIRFMAHNAITDETHNR